MTDQQTFHLEKRVTQTRMPYRVAAFLLGMLFMAFGFQQILGGATDGLALGFAVLIVLTGLQFMYAAISNRWQFLLGTPRGETVQLAKSRFAMVEPLSLVAFVRGSLGRNVDWRCAPAMPRFSKRPGNRKLNRHTMREVSDDRKMAERKMRDSAQVATPRPDSCGMRGGRRREPAFSAFPGGR